MRLIETLRALRGEERGFTMVMVMTVMFSVTLLSIAALSAAQNDLAPGSHDRSRKVAYAAAEAGVQNYLFHLSEDLEYWSKCTTGAQPHAVNDPWDGVSPAADPRVWQAIPSSDARYTIELLPANGRSVCSVADSQSVIDNDTGTFKIRSTGEDREDGVKRSIIATFKRKSLLDYLYLTDKETVDPGLYTMNIDSRTTRETSGAGRDIVTWARQQCDKYWGDDASLGGRGGQAFNGESLRGDGSWAATPAFSCSSPQFKAGDVIAGPFHTNDEILVDCGSPAPQFGDSVDDVVETSSLGQTVVTPANPKGGWRQCAASEPYVNFSTTSPVRDAGTWSPRAASLQLPDTNASLKAETAAAYQFKGTTKIRLSGTTMRVTGTRLAAGSPALVDVDMAIPADGVVYVANDGSCPEYNPQDAYAAPSTCGNLEIEGDYAANVTFTAENDILVKADLTRTSASSNFLLGLIAQNYVRMYHPVTGCSPSSPLACNAITGCSNDAATPTNLSVTAAILSLTRSMIVDNWFCGASLGELRIEGAIAQLHRGPTGRDASGGGSSGYTKRYVYDTQLKYRAPPHFLNPVNAQWRVQTFSEQVPAR